MCVRDADRRRGGTAGRRWRPHVGRVAGWPIGQKGAARTGIALGVALGAAMDNLAVGVAIGVAIGAGLGGASDRPDDDEKTPE